MSLDRGSIEKRPSRSGKLYGGWIGLKESTATGPGRAALSYGCASATAAAAAAEDVGDHVEDGYNDL